ITTGVVIAGIVAMMFWQFSQPPFLRKASMNTELNEVLDAGLQKIPYILVLNKDVAFTNEKYRDTPVATFSATIMLKDTVIEKEELKSQVISHLKKNMDYDIDNLYEVYNI